MAQQYRQHFHPPDRQAPVCLSFRLYNERATTGLSEVKTSSYASSRKKDHPRSVVHHSILFGVSTIQRALSQASQPTLPVNPSIAEYPQLSSSVTKITFAISGSFRCSMHHCLNASLPVKKTHPDVFPPASTHSDNAHFPCVSTVGIRLHHTGNTGSQPQETDSSARRVDSFSGR